MPEACRQANPRVVVPVFNAVAETRRCLAAVLRTAPGARVLVIDDGSTDPGIEAVLAQCPAHWTVVRAGRNRGFVATANAGMDLAGDEDVILLNSDTVPAGDWLERMVACARSDPRIASITPFSNHGEIVSLPDFCRAAPIPADPERWAAACRAAGPPVYPELPTAVGFCMYLRRACLDQIGGFDAEHFGRGYGEENDWCMRAQIRGWRHVLCDDAYVAHQGGASFAPLNLRPGPESMARLLQRHPNYLERIEAFIAQDPLAPLRARILAQLAPSVGQTNAS